MFRSRGASGVAARTRPENAMRTIVASEAGEDVQSEYEYAPCPYCRRKDCRHEVLVYGHGNCAWYGALADATRELSHQIEPALWEYFKAGHSKAPSDGSGELQLLIEAAEEGFKPDDFESCDWYRCTCDYWIALADRVMAGEVTEVIWDVGGPGQSDTYVHAHFKTPAAGIGEVVKVATADLRALQRKQSDSHGTDVTTIYRAPNDEPLKLPQLDGLVEEEYGAPRARNERKPRKLKKS